MSELVAIARLVRSRGIKGELVAEILTDFPERFELLKTVISVNPQGDRRELKIEKSWFQSGRIVLKFEGYDSIESAETLRNLELCVPESDAVGLASDEFFEWSLKGCEVENVDGTVIGTVSEVMRTGGTDLLVVKGAAKEYLIPFAESICTEVDIDNKLIKVDPPDGLLDF